MNCNDFKNKVADLFDKNIDMHIKAQMNEHMANCHECKAYYDELRETFSMLQPKEAANMSKAKTTHRLWHYAAVAAVFLFGFIIGWSHLFSTPAVADDTKLAFIRQSIQSVQNVGSFQMEVYARTTQQDNFAYFSPGLPFVKTDIQLLRQNDSLFYRVEKANGRTVVSDGREQYMWIPNSLYIKGSQETNFLEHFTNLMFPERLLAMQESAIALSKENNVTQTETDTTIVLTVEGTEKYSDLRQLFETGHMDDCRTIVESTFTKNDATEKGNPGASCAAGTVRGRSGAGGRRLRSGGSSALCRAYGEKGHRTGKGKAGGRQHQSGPRFCVPLYEVPCGGRNAG